MKITEKELKKVIKEAVRKKMASLREGNDYTALRQIVKAAENTSMSFEDEIVKLLNLYPPDQLPEPAQKLYHQIVTQLSDRFVEAVSDATRKLSKFKKKNEAENMNESKKSLKNIFLNEEIGSKEYETDLETVQFALNSMKSLLDKGAIDKGNPAYKDVEKAVNSMTSLLGNDKQLSEMNNDKEDAFSKAWQEKEESLETKTSFKDPGKLPKGMKDNDEPFQKLEECGMEDEKEIFVEPQQEPLDNIEYVQIIFPEEGETENTSFHAPGSPDFDSRENEIVDEIHQEPEEDENEDKDYMDDVLRRIEDEDFGRFDYPGSEEKPKGF